MKHIKKISEINSFPSTGYSELKDENRKLRVYVEEDHDFWEYLENVHDLNRKELWEEYKTTLK